MSRELRIEYVAIDEIARWPRNPKEHDEPTINALIDRFGFVNPMIRDDASGRLVVGHGRLDVLIAKMRAGERPPDGIRVRDDGMWLVPVVCGVRFANVDEAEIYVVGDNSSGERGGWNDAALAEIFKDLASREVSFEGVGFDVDAILAGLESDGDDSSESDERPDEDEEVEIAPSLATTTQDGDVWQLGPHRVYCGDCSVAEVVDRALDGRAVAMIATDPPFAIYGSSSGIGSDIADDRMVRPFFEAMFRTCHRVLMSFGHCYVHCDWRSWSAVYDSARRADMSAKNCLVWDKGDAGLGSSYGMSHEFVGFFAKLPPPAVMKGNQLRGQRVVLHPNILRHGRVRGAERNHNASKPVALTEHLIENSSDVGDVVLDLFGGGGSSLIAAEKQGRVAVLIDINPRCCDAMVERWQKFTGKRARRFAKGPKRRKRAS